LKRLFSSFQQLYLTRRAISSDLKSTNDESLRYLQTLTLFLKVRILWDKNSSCGGLKSTYFTVFKLQDQISQEPFTDVESACRATYISQVFGGSFNFDGKLKLIPKFQLNVDFEYLYRTSRHQNSTESRKYMMSSTSGYVHEGIKDQNNHYLKKDYAEW